MLAIYSYICTIIGHLYGLVRTKTIRRFTNDFENVIVVFADKYLKCVETDYVITKEPKIQLKIKYKEISQYTKA